MTQFLLGLYALVMLSGFWGLALQHIVPKLMREYLPDEVIFEQIPYIRGLLVAQAQAALEKLARSVAAAGPTPVQAEGGTATQVAARPVVVAPIVTFLQQEALPYLQATNPRRQRLREQRIADDVFRLLKLQVAESIHPVLDQVHELCDEKRRLDFQVRLHHWLHGWLLLHAPASILLVVLTIWHAIVATFTYA